MRRTDDLRAAHDETAAAHLREDLADSFVHFFELDCVLLKSAVKSSVHGPENESDHIWVILKCLFEAIVVARVV